MGENLSFDKDWQRLAKIGKDWQRLAEISKDWQRLAEHSVLGRCSQCLSKHGRHIVVVDFVHRELESALCRGSHIWKRGIS